MKKLLLLITFVFVSIITQAQDGQLQLGAQLGIPTGNAGDAFSIALGVDGNYLFTIEDQFSLGPASALILYLGKENVSNSLLWPLAAAGRFRASDKVDLGLDFGFVIGLSNAGNDVYFKPSIGYYIEDNMQLYAGYTGLGDTGHFTLGVMFSLD